MATTTIAVDGVRGYFQSQRAGLDAQLAARLTAYIDDAEVSLDCAIYDLRHPLILAALARAVARKVHVRIAYDAGKERVGGLSEDPKSGGTHDALAKAGLLGQATAVHEHGRHLMHDKFVLRDGHDVWVGSANFTQGGLELQDNTCLAVSSPELVARFETTFTELLQPEHRHTSASSTDRSPVPVGAGSIIPMFAPSAGEGIEHEIVSAINSSRKIRLLAFLLSDPAILEALAPLAHDPRFDIRGVYDPHGMQDVLRYSRQDSSHFWFMHDPRFVAAPSHAFSAKREQDFMHNKTLIIDDEMVLTGSYNFSENAEANDEVFLKIESAPLAAAYSAYFDRLFETYARASKAPTSRGATKVASHARLATANTTSVTHANAASQTRKPTRGLDILIWIVALLAIAAAVALVVALGNASVLPF
ncbi:MAG TPA: phospholipase D-like domain-containing protein [Ktedonobacterales bacterium]|nr:phospholipase D-like domain-containing protein [Ktedonobacterales bacterium]